MSLTGRPTIYVKAGDDFSLRIGAQNDDGTPRDLTGETIEFRAAPDFNWLGPIVYKTDGDGITIEDAEAGVFEISVLTGRLHRAGDAGLGGEDHRYGRQRVDLGLRHRARQ